MNVTLNEIPRDLLVNESQIVWSVLIKVLEEVI